MVLRALTLRLTRTPPALPSALSQLLASSASPSASAQAGPVSFISLGAKPMLPPLATTLNSQEPGSSVINAIDRLLSEDRYLFTNNANERSLTHRLACYLQFEFADWHVDCEYNRDINSSDKVHFRKRLLNLPLVPSPDDTEGRTVFPDIIVHKRGSNKNFIVIEVKKSNSSVSREVDLGKLQAYKSELGYVHALFLVFKTGNAPSLLHAEWVGA